MWILILHCQIFFSSLLKKICLKCLTKKNRFRKYEGTILINPVRNGAFKERKGILYSFVFRFLRPTKGIPFHEWSNGDLLGRGEEIRPGHFFFFFLGCFQCYFLCCIIYFFLLFKNYTKFYLNGRNHGMRLMAFYGPFARAELQK